MQSRTQQRKLTSADLLQLKQVSDARMHPSRPCIAYVIAESVSAPKQQQVASRIWSVATDGESDPRPLTAQATRAHKPRWSPDGSMLAFLGNRDIAGKDQLFVLDDGWGEARQITDAAGGVIDLFWGPEVGTLTLLISDPPPDGHEEREKIGADQVEYEEHPRYNRLFRCELASEATSPLARVDTQVYEFAWSPDGADLVALVADAPHNWNWYGAYLALLDRESGDWIPLFRSSKQFTAPTWSHDGTRIAVISCVFSDQGMTGGDVLLIDRDGEARNLTEGHPRSYLSVAWERSGERLLCTALEDGESVLGYLGVDGTFETLWRDKASIWRYGAASLAHGLEPGRPIAMARSTPHEPFDVWTVDPHAAGGPRWQRHTRANPDIASIALGDVETLHWSAPDGLAIQGLLIRPPGAERGKRLPMIVHIHGGPTGLWAYEFPGARSMGWAQLLAAEGYAVFLPNYRGSMGFGTTFAELNQRDMGGGDLADILAGVDYCVAQGIADPERLGVCGWSYGGYLTPWAITQTTRFKAAVAGAVITNWISYHGVATIPGFDTSIYRSDPHDWDGIYGQMSPMAHVKKVRTPTLWLHGQEDPICPVGQAHEMWRALKELGVETQLVTYPREGHGMKEREHARDVLDRAVTWLRDRV